MKKWNGDIPEEKHIALHESKTISGVDRLAARIKEYGNRREARLDVFKLIITDKGDPSVGLYPQDWCIDVPFNRPNTPLSNDDTWQLEEFRFHIQLAFKDFCEGRCVAEYDFEIENYKDSDGE